LSLSSFPVLLGLHIELERNQQYSQKRVFNISE